MKTIRRICLLLALVALLAVTAYAQQGNLKISNATATAGQTVYLTLELTQSIQGNVVSVKYDYNSTLLEFQEDSSSWVRSSMLSDFDKTHSTGVWSVKDAIDLKGGLCILAFKVREDADFTKEYVSCEVNIKNGNKTVNEEPLTATAVITMDCAHSYGSWKDAGNAGHTRTCTLCKQDNTQSHTWDQGKELQTKDPGKVEMLYTCTVCGGTKTVTQNKEQEILPTFSKPTDEDETKPTPKPTQPQGPLTPTVKPGEIPELTDPPHGKPTESTAGHDHETDLSKSTVPSHNHDHDPVTQPQNEANPVLTGAVIAVAVTALVTAAVLVVKKNSR